MLLITVPAQELWDESKLEFVSVKEQTLQLEHSLVSLSKWESKWEKAFIGYREKTPEETMDYIKCMTLTPDTDPLVYHCLSDANIAEINRYITAPMTATHFFGDENDKKTGKDTITAELIYFFMIAYGIPFECQNWHLNRLLTLIRVCEIKSKPPKKRSRQAIMQHNTALNAARRKQLHTKG